METNFPINEKEDFRRLIVRMETLAQLDDAWELRPELRLGQLLSVVAKPGHLFYVTDEDLVKKLKMFVETNT